LHLSPGNAALMRRHGDLKRIDDNILQSEDIRAMVYAVMSDDQRAEFERDLELDFAIALGEKARFRVNAFTTRTGTAAVFRTIPSLVPTMDELELPAIMKRFAELEKGLILVTGPTGSGKSTTLASMINHINTTMAKHIITIEDPVEFFHTSKQSLINHREIGQDTKSFAKALRSSLREDPDVILVGEMRDYETISLALTAAETGHLVFATLHSNSATKTIDRIIDVFPTGDKEMVRAMLASSLQGVVAQTLLKRQGGGGRVGVYEVLVGTNAVRNLIRENQVPQLYSMIQTGTRYGMITMDDAVNALIEQGLVDEEEARTALLRATDSGGEMDEDTGNVSAALGGGKRVDAADAAMQKKMRGFTGGPGAPVGGDEEEGYSF
jgi:twitching motility protein PilT